MSILQGIVDTVVKPGIILAGESSLAVAYLFILFTIVTCIIELVFKNSI